MKIVHVTYSMDFGGIETMLVNIMNEQVNSDEVVLLMINNQYAPSLLAKLDKRIKIINVGRPIGSKNPLYLFLLNYFLIKEAPSIIHIHHPGIIRFIAFLFFKRKIVFTMHDIPTPKDLRYIYRYPKIFAISDSVRNSLLALKLDSVVVTNGIRIEDFKKKEYTCRNNIFKIVQIGRLYYEKKGQDILIKACAILATKGKTDFHIDFIGDGVSLQYLEQLVNSLSLNEYVTFLGAKPYEYIAEHLKDYDLFVQPSRREGFGLTVAEAMAAKVPVLVSNQEGPMEIIDNGEFGFCFENNDVDKCADKIEEIMNMKFDNDILERAYTRVEERYDVKRTANEYVKEYRKYVYKE